jgi:two-component system response regulator MprA
MKTVLIVDDDEEIRTVMRRILSVEGFIVLEAENGQVALEIAREKIPDLIISDIMMENVNGFMLFEFLRGDTSTDKIPVILATGKAQKAGAWEMDPSVAYLEKPIAPDELLAAVKRMMKS